MSVFHASIVPFQATPTTIPSVGNAILLPNHHASTRGSTPISTSSTKTHTTMIARDHALPKRQEMAPFEKGTTRVTKHREERLAQSNAILHQDTLKYKQKQRHSLRTCLVIGKVDAFFDASEKRQAEACPSQKKDKAFSLGQFCARGRRTSLCGGSSSPQASLTMSHSTLFSCFTFLRCVPYLQRPRTNLKSTTQTWAWVCV